MREAEFDYPAPVMEPRIQTGADGEHHTYCRICEACCGLTVTVESGRIARIAPDAQNPHSQGHSCVKGIHFDKVVHDRDRVTRPLRRGSGGDFEEVGWDQALDDIASRLTRIRDRHGPQAIASYLGNPTGFSINTGSTHGKLMRALGTRRLFSPGSQDQNARLAANCHAYGSAAPSSFPDLPRTDLLLIFGANPLVSNGSLIFAPRIRHDLDAIARRGRVIVIDPRRTETASRYDHVSIRPNGDAWLLIGIIAALVEEGLVETSQVTSTVSGWPQLEEAVCAVAIDEAALRAGVPAAEIREIARLFAATPRAAAYGRVGIGRGPYATLTNFLLTALNAIGGKSGRPGGDIFGYPILAGSEKTRPGGLAPSSLPDCPAPSVLGFEPAALLPQAILNEGPGQIRAMLVTAGNPLLSAPGGAELERALSSLELLISLDIYVNETARFADYILPVTTFLERADLPYVGMGCSAHPFIQYTDAVIPPVGEAREEHDIYHAIADRMGIPLTHKATGGVSPTETPLERYDGKLRDGPAGDRCKPGGWSFDKLREFPHGVMAQGIDPPWTNFAQRLAHEDGKVCVWNEAIGRELQRLLADPAPAGKLQLIGRRDIRSINSWMHNIGRLVRSQHPALLVHPVDAAKRGLADGDEAIVSTGSGSLQVRIEICDDVRPETVSYPHGWGHEGGWQRANSTSGENVNLLLKTGTKGLETASGVSLIDGIAVDLTRRVPER